ncbi:MAG: hypothetical protein A2168_00725 [Planctomycetes bacterium RBG_13_50_24]|nr:MAG: hypothetical protein A2168_00725 [Planctomycetes bacterium RBG_13_50_24]
MKRLVITWALAVGLFGLAGFAEAEQSDTPFVNVSTTPDKLDLGTASLFMDTYDVPAALTVKVEANCMHGPIMISTTKLKHRRGGSISPERVFVKTPATDGFVTMARPVAISKPTTGSHKIVLDLRVETQFLDPAGEYTGTLMLTIMPPV